MVFRVGEGGSRPNTMRARTCRFAELEGFEPFNLWLSGVWDQWDVMWCFGLGREGPDRTP